MFVKQLNGFTVAQLKDELNSRSLETTGKKAELVVRLASFLEEHEDDALTESLTLGVEPKKTPVKNGSAEKVSKEKVTPKKDGENEVAEEKMEQEENDKVEQEQDMNIEDLVVLDSDAGDTETAQNDESANTADNDDEQSMAEAMAEATEVLDEVGPDEDDEAKKKEEEEKKKAAAEEEKKKAAEKARKKRHLLRWPAKDELLQERRMAMKLKTIVMGPIGIEDLESEMVKKLMAEAVSFHFRTHRDRDDKIIGSFNALLKTKKEAIEFVDALTGLRDDARIEQCGPNMSQEKFHRELKTETEPEWNQDRLEHRTVIIRNLPEDTKEEALKEIFPDAPNISLVRNHEDKCKEWGYIEFETSKEGQAFIDKYRGKTEDEQPKYQDEVLRVGTLQHVARLWSEPKKEPAKQDKAKDKSTDKDKEAKSEGEGDEEAKKEDEEKKEVDTTDLLSDEERLRKPQLVRMWKQRLTNLEPLKDSRPEYYEKQKKVLTENIKNAEEALAADEKKRKELGIALPEEKKTKKEADDRKNRDNKMNKKPGNSMGGGNRPQDRNRDRRDQDRRQQDRKRQNPGGRFDSYGGNTGGFGGNTMTREQWQKNRNSWSSPSPMGGTIAPGQNQAATANAVNLLVGLSKIFGNQQGSAATGGGGGGGSGSYGGYSGGTMAGGYGSSMQGSGSMWNQSNSSSWNQGGSTMGGYSGGYSSNSGPANKRRKQQQQQQSRNRRR